jgi:guanylate kinase
LNPKNGKIFVIAAPSGAGKTTITRCILKLFPELVFSISATTRKKRFNEQDGVDYFFITEKDFVEKIEKNEFVEWEKTYDYYYGTFKSFLTENVNNAKNVILEIDVNGALSIKKLIPHSVLIFIRPPSFEVLVERLKARKTESEKDLHKRIDRVKMELGMADKFDYSVENNELAAAVKEVEEIIKKEINKE